MRIIHKNIMLGTAICSVLLIGVNQKLSATTQTKIHPLTNQMIDAINKAPTAEAAKEALCKQEGVIRGKGMFTAGQDCKAQDFARVGLAACHDYVNGKDTYMGSKCYAYGKGVGITDVQRAIDFLKATVAADVSYTTNTKLLICGPESLGANVAQYRAKLPANLRKIADESCGGSKAVPARPTSAAPALPKEKAQKMLKEDVAYMDELRRVLQEGVKLKPVRGRLNSVARNVTVSGQQVSIPTFTIPEVKDDQIRNDLLTMAQKMSKALQGVAKAIEEGDTLSEADVAQASKLKEDMEKAQTGQDLVQVLKKQETEIAQWSSGKARIKAELERMRLQGQ